MMGHYMTLSTTGAAWNAEAARIQAERAMRAEQERDSLVAVVARLSRELEARDEEIRQLRMALAAEGESFPWYAP